VRDITFVCLEQFQSSQSVIEGYTTAAVGEHHVIAVCLHYSAADGVTLAVVLSVSDYFYIDSVAIFIAGFFGFISRRVAAAVVGNYNFPVEAVFQEKFAGGFDISSDFAAFVKCGNDD
jgi:hypothetical protein